jgi:hypothetical protein
MARFRVLPLILSEALSLYLKYDIKLLSKLNMREREIKYVEAYLRLQSLPPNPRIWSVQDLERDSSKRWLYQSGRTICFLSSVLTSYTKRVASRDPRIMGDRSTEAILFVL